MSMMTITIYLVGTDVDDACSTYPFDSYESADSFRADNPGTNIYEVDAVIDFLTVRLSDT